MAFVNRDGIGGNGGETMLCLHERWKRVMKARELLVDPMDSSNKRCFIAENVVVLERRDARLHEEEKQLVSEMLARAPSSPEDYAVLGDLALTYDAPIPSEHKDVESPACYSGSTHIARLVAALRRNAPSVVFWFQEQDLHECQRDLVQSALS